MIIPSAPRKAANFRTQSKKQTTRQTMDKDTQNTASFGFHIEKYQTMLEKDGAVSVLVRCYLSLFSLPAVAPLTISCRSYSFKVSFFASAKILSSNPFFENKA